MAEQSEVQVADYRLWKVYDGPPTGTPRRFVYTEVSVEGPRLTDLLLPGEHVMLAGSLYMTTRSMVEAVCNALNRKTDTQRLKELKKHDEAKSGV